MIKISDNVALVLDKLYLRGLTNNNQTLYNKCIEAIQSLKNDIPYCGTIIAKDEKYPRSWRAEQTFVLKVGRYCFSYEKSRDNIVVSEVFDLQTRKLLEHKNHTIEPVPLFEEFCSMI